MNVHIHVRMTPRGHAQVVQGIAARGRASVQARAGAEQIQLHFLDPVLGYAAGAVRPPVQLGGRGGEAGQDEARVVTLGAAYSSRVITRRSRFHVTAASMESSIRRCFNPVRSNTSASVSSLGAPDGTASAQGGDHLGPAHRGLHQQVAQSLPDAPPIPPIGEHRPHRALQADVVIDSLQQISPPSELRSPPSKSASITRGPTRTNWMRCAARPCIGGPRLSQGFEHL
jgi:hypothetical protein